MAAPSSQCSTLCLIPTPDILLRGEGPAPARMPIARYIMKTGNRSETQLCCWRINWAPWPESLIESELSVTEAGAVTGAEKRRFGNSKYGPQGTLVSRRAGSMPLALQVKTLPAARKAQVAKARSNLQIAVDVRIIAATKSDLKRKGDAGDFHAASVLPANVVQRSDIPPLLNASRSVPSCSTIFALDRRVSLRSRKYSTDARPGGGP